MDFVVGCRCGSIRARSFGERTRFLRQALDYQLLKFIMATLDPTNPERIKAERMSMKDLSAAVFGLPMERPLLKSLWDDTIRASRHLSLAQWVIGG